jgi:hypothetical protein
MNIHKQHANCYSSDESRVAMKRNGNGHRAGAISVVIVRCHIICRQTTRSRFLAESSKKISFAFWTIGKNGGCPAAVRANQSFGREGGMESEGRQPSMACNVDALRCARRIKLMTSTLICYAIEIRSYLDCNCTETNDFYGECSYSQLHLIAIIRISFLLSVA